MKFNSLDFFEGVIYDRRKYKSIHEAHIHGDCYEINVNTLHPQVAMIANSIMFCHVYPIKKHIYFNFKLNVPAIFYTKAKVTITISDKKRLMKFANKHIF